MTLGSRTQPNHKLHALLRHRLLRQPHGFEGLCPVAVNVNAANLAAAHPKRETPTHVERQPTGPASTHRASGQEDTVLALDDPLHVRLALERLRQRLPETGDGLRADTYVWAWKLCRVVPHGVVVEPVPGTLIVAAANRFERGADDLHVLLRHR